MLDATSETHCPICQTPSGSLADWLDIPVDVKTGKPISTGKLVWCKSCDMGMMRRLPTPSEIRESYDLERYYTHGQSHIANLRPGLMDRIRMKLAYLTDRGQMIEARELERVQPDMRRVLDIGCGGGGFVGALKAEGRELYGIDPDPKSKAAATAKGVTVYEGTAEEIPDAIRGQTFDLVILSHALEHCTDPALAIRNACSLVAPGGTFYCVVPNCGSIYFQTVSEISEMLDVPRHLYFFTPNALKKLLEDNGFQTVDWVFNGYTRHFLPGWRAWENKIRQQLVDHGGGKSAPRRNLLTDLGLLVRSAFAPPARKYDCVGLIARPRR
jgi:SAM-dependent methyltransferase